MTPKVSQFSSARAKAAGPAVTVDAILSAIKEGKWKEQIQTLRELSGKEYDKAKSRLPAFSVSGVFTHHADDGLVEHSGLVQVDIDGKDNPEKDLSDIAATAKKCPFVYAGFRSPGGKGLKLIVKCPPNRADHSGSYRAAATWLHDKGIVVDKQVCALSQFCFVSYDENLWVNKKSVAVKPLTRDEGGEKEVILEECEETRSREEILDTCRRLYEDFEPLWTGDYEDITPNHSVADHSLICMLRDNCFSNEMVAELFMESGLYRPEKWPGRTRDYVFSSLRKTEIVRMLADLPLLPPIEGDEERKKKRKGGAGWAWETIGAIPEWKAEDERYVIKKMLYANTVACFFGAPGAGKSFCVFSFCAAVAAGRDWDGRKVSQGGVLYFGLEGSQGVRKRLQAMRQEGQLGNSDPFATVCFVGDSMNMMKEDHIKKAVTTAKAFEAETEKKLQILVIDTLARATPGSDENSTKDMGVVMNAAQQIAIAVECCVVVVHHSGKEAGRGMRGSTALPGGFDTVYEILKNEDDPRIRSLKARKQRDDDDTAETFFRLEVVKLGIDEDGDDVTTCVVKLISADDVPQKRSKTDVDADTLLPHIPAAGITLPEIMVKTGLSRTTAQRRLEALIRYGSVMKDGQKYIPAFEDLDEDPL